MGRGGGMFLFKACAVLDQVLAGCHSLSVSVCVGECR